MEWKDIWKEDPQRFQEIFFLTRNKEIHYGEIYSDEKLRKCSFPCYICKEDEDCDTATDDDYRVKYWFPVPKVPED